MSGTFLAEDPRRHDSLSVILSVSIVLLALGLLYLYNLGGWLINDDEGSFLYQVWRITEGERPYQDVFTSRWPLFLYSGAGWMHMVGPDAVRMRWLAVLATLGTAVFVFLMAREALSPEAALLSLCVFLLHPDVFRFGRSFQPESLYMFFSILGLYLFGRGQAKGRLVYLVGAGIALALATLYKLLAALVLGGCMLFLVVTWARERRMWSRTALQMLALLLPYGMLFGITTVWFSLSIPRFYASVIGVNLAQGQELTLTQVAFKGLAFLVRHFLSFCPFFLLAFPAAWRGWFGEKRMALLSWQLLAALAFLVLSRELFPRLLLYMVPSLSILFAATLEAAHLIPRKSLLLWSIVGAVLVPWLATDAQLLVQEERDTMAVSSYIQDRTSPDDRVLSDYQDLNFYAQRPSTYLGAEISYVIVAGEQITGADLIAEIEEAGVKMVLVDVSPQTAHQMVNLTDYEDFRAYLQERFLLLTVLPRGDQRLEVYSKP